MPVLRRCQDRGGGRAAEHPPRLAAPELEFILSDSGSRVLVYGEEFAGVADAVKAGAEHPCTVESWVPTAGGRGALAERLEAAADDEPTGEHGGSDNLFIMYTSGTTGLPKGVVHNHDSVHTGAAAWAMTVDGHYKDRILLPLPMFHVAALTTVIFCAMRGVSLISMPQFDPVKIWSLIVDERVSVGGAVPAILNFMRLVPQFEELDAPCFRTFITGGAPMPESLIKMYAAKNMEVVQGYALTESCRGGTMLLGDDALRKVGSAGRATMFADVRVRSDDGAIIGIPGVSTVAVIGLPDEKWGEIACAIVVADQSSVSEEGILDYCGTRLARSKLPKKVIFTEEIPHSPAGKILKRALRDKYV